MTEDTPLYVGVEWLGPYEKKLDPTLASNLAQFGSNGSVAPTGTGNSSTNEYVEALEGVLTTATTMDFTGRQTIVLLTDGTFSGDDREHILSALLGLCLSKAEVYVILCNQDRDNADVQRGFQFWQSHTRAVYDIDAIAGWLPDVARDISGGSLPVGIQTTPNGVRVSGWLTTTDETLLPAVPGDVSSVSAYILNIPLTESRPFYVWRQSFSADAHFLLEEGTNNLFSTGNLSIAPRPSCIPHNEICIRHEGRSVGFYWAEFTRPNVSMQITPSVSINNESASIEVTLDNVLPAWAPCYQVQLTSEGSSDQSDFDTDLRAHLIWTPSAGEPREQGYVSLLTSAEILDREACRLQVVFEPHPVNNHVQASRLDGIPYTHSMEFQFQYAQEAPEVLLCTSKNRSEISLVNSDPTLRDERGQAADGGSLQCPTPQESPLHFGSRECYISQVEYSDAQLSSALVASAQAEPGENHLVTVRVQMYGFLWKPQQCGYQTLIFRWPESSNTHAITWVWEYDNSSWNLWQQ